MVSEDSEIFEELSDLSPEDRVIALAAGVKNRQSEIKKMTSAIQDLKENQNVSTEIETGKLLYSASESLDFDQESADKIKDLQDTIQNLKNNHRMQLEQLKSDSNAGEIEKLIESSGKSMPAGSNFAQITRHYTAELVDFKSDFAETTSRLEDDNDRKYFKNNIDQLIDLF